MAESWVVKVAHGLDCDQKRSGSGALERSCQVAQTNMHMSLYTCTIKYVDTESLSNVRARFCQR